MLHKRKTSIATLALLFALAVAPKSLAASRWASNSNPESHPTRTRTATTSMKESGRSGEVKLVVRGGEGGEATAPTSVLWPNWNWQSPEHPRPSVDAIAATSSAPERSATGFSVANSRLETLQGKSIESGSSDSGVMPPPIPVWLLTILPAAALLGVLLWWMQRDDHPPKSTTADKQDLSESPKLEEPENLGSELEPEPHPVASAEPATEEIPPSPDAERTATETSELPETDIRDSEETYIQDPDDTYIQAPETLTVSETATEEGISAEIPPLSEAENRGRGEMAIAANPSLADAKVTSTTTEPSPDIAETDMETSELEPASEPERVTEEAIASPTVSEASEEEAIASPAVSEA
ncbi:MAG: hypothetical protein ACP5D7_18380, partial [Limnospira sp.]